MQARQLRRARESHRSFDRPRPYLPSTGLGYFASTDPSYERPFLLRVSSTGPAYVWCFASTGPGEPQILRQAPPMSGARGARPYCLRAVLCFASTGPGVLRQPPLTSYAWCFALLTSTAPGLTFDSPRGALLCPALPHFDSPRLCALLCLALLRHPPALLLMRGALLCLAWPGLTSTPPGGALPGLTSCVFCLLCFACFACLLTYVFPTHTEGGDPGSLHEKKIKTKEF